MRILLCLILWLLCLNYTLPHVQGEEVLVETPALVDALQKDKWSTLSQLLPQIKNGENPYVRSQSGEVTLGELCIIIRAWDCLKNMLRCGIKPTLEMVELSGELGNYQTYEQLLRAQGPMSAKQTLEFSGEALKLALQHSGDPNATGPIEKLTPLMTHQKLEDLNLLLQHGADVNAQDINGRSALFYQRGIKQLELLLKHGADIHLLDKDGHSALDYWANDKVRQEYLISQGAQSHKPIDLIQITKFGDHTITMNDLDNYAYLIVNEDGVEHKEESPIFYFAQRFPRVQVRQTRDWENFKAWIQELPAESLIHRYDRCQDAFTPSPDWVEAHQLEVLFTQLRITEGEERIYCICGKDEDGTIHP